jgi:integrase
VRKKSEPTKYPGVHRISETSYRVRGKVRNPKTGKFLFLDKIVEASSAYDASNQRAELLLDLQNEVPSVIVERLRLEAFARSWLRSRLPKLKKATRALYASILDNHIAPSIGEYYVDAVATDDLVQWRDDMVGKGASAAAVNTRIRLIKTILRDAVDELQLPRDPTRRLVPLRDVRSGEPKSLTAPELAKFLAAAQEHAPDWHTFFSLLAFTGLRFGEATALKWTDIDEEHGVIHVRRAQWKGAVDTPKTGKTRTVPLSEGVAALLAQHKEQQRKASMKRLKRQRVPNIEEAMKQAEGWVFPSRGGTKLMHNTAPRKPLATCVEKAKIEKAFTVHGFRHTFNNLLRQATQDAIVIQSMTGHSSGDMTQHYSHVGVEEKRKALGGVLRLVEGA